MGNWATIDWLMNGLVQWLGRTVEDLLGGLLAFLTAHIFVSPDVTVLPQVHAVAARSAMVVDACYGLAIVTAGIVVMVSGSAQVRYGIKELLPRLVVGFVLSNLALLLCSALIEVANAVTVAMVGPATPTERAVTAARTHVAAALSDEGTAMVAVILGVLIVVLLYVLVAGWLVRVAVLVVLAGVAPVALACYALPFTQPAAALWWRTLLGCLGTAALQAVAFSTGIRLLLDPDAGLPVALGLPGSDVLNLLLVAVVLWLTVKIPALMRRYVTRSSITTAGLVMRAVVIQTVTRRLRPGRRAR
jgi:hypothetical protein